MYSPLQELAVNPLTGRFISIYGALYLKLVQTKVIKDEYDDDLTEADKKQIAANKAKVKNHTRGMNSPRNIEKNPLTGRLISKDGPLYEKLVRTKVIKGSAQVRAEYGALLNAKAKKIAAKAAADREHAMALNSKPCKDKNNVRSPVSGKCIKKDGALYSKLVHQGYTFTPRDFVESWRKLG
jgi:biotin carboxyl carrier protein